MQRIMSIFFRLAAVIGATVGHEDVLPCAAGAESTDCDLCFKGQCDEDSSLLQLTGRDRSLALDTFDADPLFERGGIGSIPFWPKACRQTPRNDYERLEYCKVARQKEPCILDGIWNGPSSEKKMSAEQKYQFEHGLARQLIRSDVISQTTREVGNRMYKFVVNGARELDGLDEDAALTKAFSYNCQITFTGYAGTEPNVIRQILLVNGNMREVWCLAYCLVKNNGFLGQLFQRSDLQLLTGIFGVSAGTRAWKAVSIRRKAVESTQAMNVNQYTWGVPDYVFPNEQNWARLSFTANLPDSVGGDLLWDGARDNTECNQTNLTTESPEVDPPLSDREVQAQCGTAGPPCRLKWYPGESCFEILKTTLYGERTKRFGYRTAAGPSASTPNMMQLALNMGFSHTDMLAFRATMVAWLVSSNDHSFIEVMLGAASLMPPEFGMQWGVRASDRCDYADFRRIWPLGYELKTSWGPHLRLHHLKLPPQTYMAQ